MLRSIVRAGSIVVASGVFAFGQAQAPVFEVASIKPAAPQTDGKMRIAMGGVPGRVNFTNVSLKDVLQRAYGVKRPQITGPSWLDSDRFNIVAKIPEGASKDDVPVMLQNLLIERFKLTVRREKKEIPVYALVAGKNGPKLEKADDDAPGAGVPGEPGPGKRGVSLMLSNGRLEARKVTLSGFADMLSNMMDRPVVDQTGIQGAYNFTLDVSMEDLVMIKGMARVGHGGAGPEGAAGPKSEGGP